jgi:hypothetical protein
VSLAVGDVSEIAHPTASSDAVVEFGVIHHVPDWRTALAEIARVLRPGGLLLFEDIPRHTLDTWLFRTFTVHPREDRFEADEFADELLRHGLRPTTALEHRFAGHAFVGAARRLLADRWPLRGCQIRWPSQARVGQARAVRDSRRHVVCGLGQHWASTGAVRHARDCGELSAHEPSVHRAASQWCVSSRAPSARPTIASKVDRQQGRSRPSIARLPRPGEHAGRMHLSGVGQLRPA